MPTDVKGDASRLIAEIEDRMKRLKELLVEEPGSPVANLGDRVLGDVLRRGASVSKHELYSIAEEHGMDRRGLGGFFRESGQNSLTELPGTDRVVLTPYGADRAQRYLNRSAREYGIGEPNLSKVAESSFAEDWNSPEDSVYDDA
jgi:hypothetical protein